MQIDHWHHPCCQQNWPHKDEESIISYFIRKLNYHYLVYFQNLKKSFGASILKPQKVWNKYRVRKKSSEHISWCCIARGLTYPHVTVQIGLIAIARMSCGNCRANWPLWQSDPNCTIALESPKLFSNETQKPGVSPKYRHIISLAFQPMLKLRSEILGTFWG